MMAIDAKKTPLGTVCIQRTPVEPFVQKRKIIDSKQRGGGENAGCLFSGENIYYKENDTPVLCTSCLQLK